jgi:hypothetical protein
METLGSNVFKSVPVANCVRALGHWDSGQIRGSPFKQHDLGSVEKILKCTCRINFIHIKFISWLKKFIKNTNLIISHC